MIVNAWGVVLTRRNWREADRLATLYTENLGKVAVRFVGVNKPGRKMKALSEPMVWGEYRLFLSPRSEIAKAIGGQLISSFPAVRQDLGLTVAALTCCDMMASITPLRSPNPEKYELLRGVLDALEKGGASTWLPAAFGARLLELSGYGLRTAPPAALSHSLWDALHDAPWEALAALPESPEDLRAALERVWHEFETQAGRPLKTRDYAAKLDLAREALPC